MKDRLTLEEYRVAVRSVRCPYCEAAPGFHCYKVICSCTAPSLDYVHDDRSAEYHRMILGVPTA